ncbi:hypothetical protein, partial [Deinococcus ruber]|uniref:hypothetical protein n=1 Tax=Deinococcus ruber TaxID=1848197 RepID=UPI001E313BF3
ITSWRLGRPISQKYNLVVLRRRMEPSEAEQLSQPEAVRLNARLHETRQFSERRTRLTLGLPS